MILWTNNFRILFATPFILKYKGFEFVLRQTTLSLTKFIENNNNALDIKWALLDISWHIFLNYLFDVVGDTLLYKFSETKSNLR